MRPTSEDVLKQLPAPDDQMRAAGLPGRVFPAVGNHEVWDDSDVEGLLSSFPYLRKFGVSDKQLTYKFDYNGARFIFLWTGPYDYRAHRLECHPAHVRRTDEGVEAVVG